MKGKEKELLAAFTRRLWLEASLKALILAVQTALLAECVAVLIMRLFLHELQISWILAVFAGAMVIALISGLFYFRPSQQRVARRVDELNMRERVITMLELREETGVIAVKQREDTLQRLEQLQAKDLQLRIHRKSLLASVAFLVLAVLLCVIPLKQSVSAGTDEVAAKQLEVTDELIVQLRQIVSDSLVTDSEKEELSQVIDTLDGSLSTNDTTLARTAKISTASKKLSSLQVSMIQTITGGLEETSEDLTEAQQTEIGYVKDTVTQMQDLMSDAITQINEIANGEEETTEAETEAADQSEQSESEQESKEEESQSEDQSQSEEEKQSEEQKEQQSQDGEQPSDEMEGGTAQEQESVAESIYDPDSESQSSQGSVPYSDVYDEYFDQAMKSLTENGEISDDMRDLIEQYFLSLH